MRETAVKRAYTAERRNGRSNAATGRKISNDELLVAISQLQKLVVASADAELAEQETPAPCAPSPVTLAPCAAAAQAIDPEIEKVREQISEMALTIDRTKLEIAAIRHPLADEDPVVTASSQLDAIVEATESATQNILDATEQVEEVIKRMIALYPQNQEMINLSEEAGGHLIGIMEACGFQDITGQRVTKVVKTLSFIEERVGAVIGIWGADAFQDIPVDKPEAEDGGDEKLMNGPQLGGQGISQDDIDALFD